MTLELVHFRFTADEYEQMIATGILTEEDRVELIDVCRRPASTGYKSIRTVGVGDSVSPLAFPDVTFAVDDLLG